MAGHETTALALTYALYCPAIHLHEQAAVAEELSSLGGQPGVDEDLPRTDRATVDFLVFELSVSIRERKPEWMKIGDKDR